MTPKLRQAARVALREKLRALAAELMQANAGLLEVISHCCIDAPVPPVLEGGNVARSSDGTGYDTPDNLQLLTTNAPLTSNWLLTTTHATSAATAQAAALAVSVMATYPALWPETVRALIVHSAEWTSAMRAQFPADGRKRPRIALLRHYGMDVPDLTRSHPISPDLTRSHPISPELPGARPTHSRS